MTEEDKKLKQQQKLNWLLNEYDCITVSEAKKLAQTDPELHRQLRECGIIFEEKK